MLPFKTMNKLKEALKKMFSFNITIVTGNNNVIIQENNSDDPEYIECDE